jgi:hypothetical protein
MWPSSERRRSGVLACHTTSEAENTAENAPPPYALFPEIADRDIFYTFPTIGANYKPANRGFQNFGFSSVEEFLIALSPNLDSIKNNLLPEIFEYCQTQYGIGLSKSVKDLIAGNFSSNLVREIWRSVEEEQDNTFSNHFVAFLRAVAEIRMKHVKDDEGYDTSEMNSSFGKIFGLAEQFYTYHEFGHRLSLAIDRPATKDVKDTTATIFDLLLQQTVPEKHVSFWATFHELNNKLMDCLSVLLALEEVRATISTLRYLDPQSQQKIIDGVYPAKRDDLESQMFHKLRTLTGDRWEIVWYWTLLMELLYPADPLRFMEELINFLNGEKANTWSDDEWWGMLTYLPDRSDMNEVISFVNEVLENPQKAYEHLAPTTYLYGLPDRVRFICTDNMRLKLFLESMRQQLAVLNLHPEHIRSLTCPFKQQGSSCCGFGYHLEGIWTGIPSEFRRRLKPPLEVCLR